MEKSKDTLAIVALVLASVAITSWIGLLPAALLAIPALICARISKRDSRNQGSPVSGCARAAETLGWCALVPLVLGVLFGGIFFGSVMLSEFLPRLGSDAVRWAIALSGGLSVVIITAWIAKRHARDQRQPVRVRIEP